MKKFLFSCLAIAAVVACAKTEDVYTPDSSEIKIAPVTAMTTKANNLGVIDGINYPKEEDFDVFAYWKNEPAGSLFTDGKTDYLIAENNSGVEFVNKGAYWGGTTTYYWPKNGSLRFAAYSPADLDMTHNLAADQYELNGLTYESDLANMYDILVARTSESYTAQTAAEKVSVVFEHALSWITFKLESTAVANDVFTVNEVLVNDVNVHGNMVAKMNEGTKTWSTAIPKQITVYGSAEGANVTTNASIFENKYDGRDLGTTFLVLPQATTTVTINFSQNEMKDENGKVTTPALTGQTVTVPLTLEASADWEAGKHYTYTVIFDLDEILINPSVEDWVEVSVPTIDAAPVLVENYEELQAAVNTGRSVRLTQDINLTTNSLVVGKSVQTKATEAAPVNVTLDLNGKSIIATSADAIVVKDGATLTINGDGKVWAATDDNSSANAIWVKHGNVTINGGSYYVGADGAKRNDCIYVGADSQKDNASAYQSTVEIYGGRFEAKVFDLNQYWALNIQDKHTTSKIIVYGGEFVNFDPSDNLSEGDNTNYLGKGVGSYELEANLWTVVSKNTPVKVKTAAALVDVAKHGGIAVLANDIALTEALCVNKAVKADFAATIDLNGHSINATSDYAIKSYAGNLTIKGVGAVVAPYTSVCSLGGTVDIKGGNYVGGNEGAATIYAYDGTINISGGSFEARAKSEALNQYSVLNCKDGQATIVVTGGKYKNFNPADNNSEGAGTSFVANGYKSVQNGDWYHVISE